MSDLIALLDMDGTLCDYDGAMQAALEALRSPYEPAGPYGHGDDSPPWLENRRRVVSTVPGFWRDLRPLPVGFTIVDVLTSAGFSLHVMTKGPKSKPLAWSEKLEWCRVHVPTAQVTVTENKSIAYGRILVDDWPPYFEAWLANRPRGLVIVPAQSWNEGCEEKHPGRVLRFDGIDADRLRAAVSAAASRPSGGALQF